MLKTRMKRIADHEARALTRLAQIEASIVALKDDDLLDLADIFEEQPPTPLKELAAMEMVRRKLAF